jgi:hypothetical protein
MRIQFRSFALGLALSTVVGAARADVIVTGTLDHLHIEASRAPIVEVLEALKKQFGIVYQYRAGPDWTVDGTFTGSLSSILPRIFQDKDYVFRIDANHSVIVFFASPQGPPLVVTSPPPPVQAPGPSRQTGQVPVPSDGEPPS